MTIVIIDNGHNIGHILLLPETQGSIMFARNAYG